jgi:hypothetical protein
MATQAKEGDPQMSVTRKIWTSAAASAAAVGTVVVVLAGGAGSAGNDPVAVAEASTASTSPRFSHPRTIDNRYLPITTRRQCEHRGEDKDGTKTRAVQTVLERTKRFVVNGQKVNAVVVKDQAYNDGKLIEIAFDYFAQADDGTVYYLGEDVNNIENGVVIDHHGTWLLGKDTDVPGVAMPAHPRLDQRFRFEDVPGVTAESNKVEEVGMRAEAAGRLHTRVIRISEFIQPEGEMEQKLYAPGVGKITEYPPDGRAELVGCRS